MIDVWKIGGSIPACIRFIVELPTNTFYMQVHELLNAASYINHFISRALVTKNFQGQWVYSDTEIKIKKVAPFCVAPSSDESNQLKTGAAKR